MTAPLILTCGDPAGIGPELAVKAWDSLRGSCPFAWIGDPAHLPPNTPYAEVTDLNQVPDVWATTLPVLRHDFPAPATPGHPDPANASAVIAVLDRAVDLVQSGAASGMCTCPINKKVLIDGANFAHPGHTEYLAARAGVDRVVMMLASPELRVVPTTIHIALADVPTVLTPDLLRETIDITVTDLRRRFGIPNPRVAVAGLNPHAGEGGAMGTEEGDWITDLITTLQGQGLAITGPHPADTLFHAAARARYDVAIAMYHDQALIPIKTLDFDQGVNVTLGLPFVRTSPDHGTAYDISGQGIANPTSTIQALKLAQQLAQA